MVTVSKNQAMSASTKCLIREHPQLKEKALVDFVNGIEVLADHIRVQEQTNKTFCGRVLSDLTGQTHDRQNSINQNVNSSLSSVSNWLQFLQTAQIESDLAFVKVAEKLAETRAGVMRLNAKHHELDREVALLTAKFEKLDTKLHETQQKLQQVDAGRLATQQLEAVFDKWQAGRLKHYPVLIRLFLVFDELYWGEFGNYCRKFNLEHKHETNRLIQQLKDKAKIQLEKDMLEVHPTLPKAWAWQDILFADVQKLELDNKELLAYLTDDAKAEFTPMLWAVNRLANGEKSLESCQQLPIVLNTQNAIERFTHEFEVRNAQQHN